MGSRDFKINNLWDKKLSRKEFIVQTMKAGVCLGAGLYGLDVLGRCKAFAGASVKKGMSEALFYRALDGGKVQCMLCPEGCVLGDGHSGFCRVRKAEGNKLFTLVFGKVCALHIDPIEKKPIFHVLPGSKALSVATAGCNSRCKYCQNWTISQKSPDEVTNRIVEPAELVSSALKNNCASIAYTYTEPIVFYEYMMESAKIADQSRIKNIMVTGGKINPVPMQQASKYIDIANVDLKGFDRRFLKEVCSQDLDDILNALKVMKKNNVWIEITNLIVPGMNDKMIDIKNMMIWIRDNLGPDTPVHFSRFWPQYKLRNLSPTPVDTLLKARETAIGAGMNFVYLGNVPGLGFENTICPGCKKVVIKRKGYRVEENNLDNGSCQFCGKKIAGLWTGL